MRIGLVGSGAMGTALGAGWRDGGGEVVTCLAGRSERTRELVAAAGLDVVATMEDVVRSDIVVSVVPPGQAIEAARDIAAAATRAGTTPLVADLNAIAPATLTRVAQVLGKLTLIDGSISGPPPSAARPTRVYLSGPAAEQFPANPWAETVLLSGGLGAASALKMCTASMYKDTRALVTQAMLTAQQHGVLAEFLADTAREWPADVPRWPYDVALAAAKSARYVGEMHEIAATQAGAGLPRQLFDGVAAVYERVAHTPLGHTAPEDVSEREPVERVLAGLRTDAPRGVLFDLSDTLFRIETAEHSLLAALGPDYVHLAGELRRVGGLNGSHRPDDLPGHLAAVWDRRDLSRDAHRAAYAGAARLAGLSADESEALYERGVSAEAWHPYPDTVRTLRLLHERGVPVAVVSNIGWDPRPVLARYGVDRDIDVLVLSDERGVQKPDAAIFGLACAELGVAPEHCVMIGDNVTNDGAATELGIRFELVAADPGMREPDALGRAAGLLA